MTEILIIVAILIGIINIAVVAILYIKNKNSKNDTAYFDDKINVLLNEINVQRNENKNAMSNMSAIMELNLNNINAMQKERIESLERQVLSTMKGVDERSENMRKSVELNLKFMNEQNALSLEKMRAVVDEKLSATLETRLNKSFEVISKSLTDVNRGLGDMQSLAKDVGGLKNVLQNVKIRGTWAETQLDNLLSQMLTKEQYIKNAAINPNTQERVDFAIVLPGKDEKVLLPIDAKFPIEEYNRIITNSQNSDVDELNKALKNLENRIKEEAKSISSKYIMVPKTTDFAIMYLPIEGLYAEVLRMDGLSESLQRNFRVVICGPNTLGAMLSSLQMGFKTVAIEKKSSEILKLLLVFKGEFTRFTDLLDKTQKKITEASDTIDVASKKTKSIARRLNKVEANNLIMGSEDEE